MTLCDLHHKFAVCAVIPPTAVSKSEDVSPPGVDQLNCNAVDCDDNDRRTTSPDCPSDSLPAPRRRGSHHDDDEAAAGGGECCPARRPLVCQCLPCDRPDDTACVPAQLRVLVREGRNAPGHCCDVYECLDRGQPLSSPRKPWFHVTSKMLEMWANAPT